MVRVFGADGATVVGAVAELLAWREAEWVGLIARREVVWVGL